MIDYELIVVRVTARFEGVSDDYRRDVAVTTRELVADGDRLRRWLELGALVALALRLRSRNRTGGRASVVWHQGIYLGALLLLASLAIGACSRLADPTRDGMLVATSLAAASALAGALGLGLRGRRSAAALLAVAGAAAYLSISGKGAGQATFASAGVLAVGGLLIGAAPRAPVSRRRALLAASLPLIGLPISLVFGQQATTAAATLTFTALVPVGLVAAGWFDPRAAAAATVLVLSRLLAGGFDELARALAIFAHAGEGTLLLRWTLMSCGVFAAWLATHRSIRRLSRA